MPLKSIKGGTWLPNRPPHLAASLSLTNALALSNTNQKAAFVVQMPRTGKIAKVAIHFQQVIDPGFATVRLETLDTANGFPSGTLIGNATGTAGILASGWHLISLGTPLTEMLQNAFFAVVVSQGGSDMIATLSAVNASCCAQEFPYTLYHAGSWSKLQHCPVFALEYEDGSYEVVQGVWPIKAVANSSYHSTSPANQRALRVKLPFPAQAVGAWV